MFSLKVSNRRKYHADSRPWRLQAYYQGSLENSLCSTESALSGSLPCDLPSYNYAELWKREGFKVPSQLGPCHTKFGLALKDKGFVLKAGIEPPREGSLLTPRDNGLARASAAGQKSGCAVQPASPDPRQGARGNGDTLETRMSSNGLQGSAMTGSNTPQGDSLQWIATSDIPVTSSSQVRQPGPPGAPSHGVGGPHATQGSRDSMLLPGPPVNPPSLFRSEPSTQRLYQSTQYGPTYPNTTSTSLAPYVSPLYNQSPYGFLPYSHYSPNASTLLYPGVDSNPYSQFLMHMQSHTSSQLPRPYLHSTHGTQFLGQNSPSTVPRAMTPLESLRKSPKLDDRRGSPKDMKGHGGGAQVTGTPPLAHQHRPSHMKHRDSSQDIKEAGYKTVLHGPLYDPSRPFQGPGVPRRPSETRSFIRPQIPIKLEEPVPKRPRTIAHTEGPSYSTGAPEPHYPPHFMKGSIIQLANGDLKRVEDLRTEDFVHSAEISNDLKIDSSTVVKIDENLERGTALLGFSVGEHRVQVTVEATLEHPFFVFGQGWSSCNPERTIQRYGLNCHRLIVGDVCISLTHKEVNSRMAAQAKHETDRARDFSATRMLSLQAQDRDHDGADGRPRQRRWSAPDNIGSQTSSSRSTVTNTESSEPRTSSSHYSSPSRGQSPISVGREPLASTSRDNMSPSQRSDV